jgi:hypothetical protein
MVGGWTGLPSLIDDATCCPSVSDAVLSAVAVLCQCCDRRGAPAEKGPMKARYGQHWPEVAIQKYLRDSFLFCPSPPRPLGIPGLGLSLKALGPSHGKLAGSRRRHLEHRESVMWLAKVPGCRCSAGWANATPHFRRQGKSAARGRGL